MTEARHLSPTALFKIRTRRHLKHKILNTQKHALIYLYLGSLTRIAFQITNEIRVFTKINEQAQYSDLIWNKQLNNNSNTKQHLLLFKHKSVQIMKTCTETVNDYPYTFKILKTPQITPKRTNNSTFHFD